MKTYHVGHLTDYRRDPKTNVFCCLCQRDIKGDVKHYVHMINGQPEILHPQDEDKYTPDGGDMGSYPIGPECAKKVGLEWCHPANSRPSCNGHERIYEDGSGYICRHCGEDMDDED